MRALLLSGCLVLPAFAGEPPVAADVREGPPVWPSHAQYMAKLASTSTNSAASEPSPGTAIDIEARYVLQVGGFRKLAAAQRATKEIGLKALRIIATRRGEQNWFVLVLGTYPNSADAHAASEAYLDAHPGGSTWVRTATDLRNSLLYP